jgi:1-deoxy-D-xylulose-5-phosphate synthase
MVLPALDAANQLTAEGLDATVVNCRFIKPMDEDVLAWVVAQHDVIITVEEGTVVNGFGAALAAQLETRRSSHPDLSIDVLGVPDRIIEHADRAQQLSEVGLDVAGIAARVRKAAQRSQVAAVRETA